MHWKFEEIFSIQFTHQKKAPSAFPDFGLDAPDFIVVPTKSTADKLRRYGWITHSLSGGLLVLSEKTIDASGNASHRSLPPTNDAFTFWLLLNNPGLLNETQPFEALLPQYAGRSRLLYFDNLSAVSLPDNKFRLTTGDFISLSDFSSGAPTYFRYAAREPQIAGIDVTPIEPGNPVAKSFNFTSPARFVDIELPESAYKIAPKPSGTAETVFLTPEKLAGKIFGAVRIFNTAAQPILEKHRKYSAVFAKI